MHNEAVHIWRNPDGSLATSIQHRVTHHSPSGWEVSYHGSGPADLALNVLEHYLVNTGYIGKRIDCFEGTCFELAWHLHQDFKREFIATMEKSGGIIPYQDIEAFLHRYLG